MPQSRIFASATCCCCGWSGLDASASTAGTASAAFSYLTSPSQSWASGALVVRLAETLANNLAPPLTGPLPIVCFRSFSRYGIDVAQATARSWRQSTRSSVGSSARRRTAS